MSDPRWWSFETRQIHGGRAPQTPEGSCTVPIYATSAFEFADADHAADLFALKAPGNIYTRIMNPTQAALEGRIAALEGAIATAVGLPGALAVASGMSAELLAVLNLASTGDHLVASPSLYGGTYNLFRHTLPRLGIDVSFVDDPGDLDQWSAAVRPTTRAFYTEMIGNPRNDVADIEGLGALGTGLGIPLIVDNTIPSPYLIRPLEHGAHIVVHSATKFLSGHGTVIAGAIVDGGTFDFSASGRHAMFTSPDPSYNGLTYWADLGPGAYIVKARVQLLRDLGPAISPFNAFLVAQGIETLSVRMERHCVNAMAVAQYLEAHPQVEKVNYSGLASSPWNALATQLTDGRGYGSVPSFVIKGGRDAGRRFVEGLALHTHVANIGDVRSLVIHPSSTTHSQLSDDEQLATGVEPGLVRLSVGLEGIDDLLSDLEDGFRAAR